MMWSYILTAIGVTGFILTGRKVWWGWYINVACQALWFPYAWLTHQYGFLLGACVYTVAFSINAVKWTRDHRDPYRHFNFNEAAMMVIPEQELDVPLPFDPDKVQWHKVDQNSEDW